MARMRVDFFSDVLGLGTSMTVLLPQRTSTRIGAEARTRAGDPPVLYLLHGLSDDDTAWSRYTPVERYADEFGLAVVMPQVHRSFYADEVHGERYWTFLSAELPATVASMFRVSTHRDDTYVAGLSMGGYGALKWALREPHRFAAAAGLSGVLDIDALRREPDEHTRAVLSRVFGDRDLAGTDDDLLHLLAGADPAALPRLHICCGTDDRLYPGNVCFAEAAAAAGVALTTDFGPGGHDWSYWDTHIRDTLGRLLR